MRCCVRFPRALIPLFRLPSRDCGTATTSAPQKAPGWSGLEKARPAAQSAPVSSRRSPSFLLFALAGFCQLALGQGIITTVAGTGTPGFSGDGGLATGANLYWPHGVAIDTAGNIYIADTYSGRIRKVSPAGIITTVAGGGFSTDGGPATDAHLVPAGVAVDAVGNIYIADNSSNRIRKVSPAGIISTVAGTGEGGFSGDGGPAAAAKLLAPMGIAVDPVGNVYFADFGNARIRKVSPAGIISTVAGGGKESPGEPGPALATVLLAPVGVAVDSAGNLYIAEAHRSLVRKVSPVGIISTVAGGGFAWVDPGDGSLATTAYLWGPVGVALDAAGNIYIAEAVHPRIRKVTPAGVITTVAGTGSSGFSGDGTSGTAARLNNPSGVAVDATGNVYIADTGNNRIRKVTITQEAAGPSFSSAGVVNAASYASGPVAPGEMITVFGSGIGPPTPAAMQLTPDGQYATKSLANTRVLFDGVAAPLVYVSAAQVTTVVPFSVAGKSSTQVQVEYMGKSSNPVTLPVAAAAPGIFTVGSTGKGQAAILHWPDYKANSPANPAARGATVMVYATTGGLLRPPGEDGKIATQPQTLQLPVTATIGGVPATVTYAGTAPGLVTGVLQANIVIPENAPGGDTVPIVLTVGGIASQPGVTLAVRPSTGPGDRRSQELVSALKELRETMLAKIDLDIDATADAFTAVKVYWRAKRWADIFGLPLQLLQSAISVVGKMTEWDPETLSQEVATRLDASSTTVEVLGSVMMLQGLLEAGGRFRCGISGPAYVDSVKQMLERADDVYGPLELDPDASRGYYRAAIKSYLDGPQGDQPSPLFVARRSTSPAREVTEVVNGALAVRRVVSAGFAALTSEIEQKGLPEGFPDAAALAWLKYLSGRVAASMRDGVDIQYDVSLWDGQRLVPQAVETKLGTVARWQKAFGYVAGQVAEKVKLEERLTITRLAKTGAVLILFAIGGPGAGEAISIAQLAFVPPEIVLKAQGWTFYRNSEEKFYMVPQEMLTLLPTEFSNLWMIADDVCQYVRYLAKEQ